MSRRKELERRLKKKERARKKKLKAQRPKKNKIKKKKFVWNKPRPPLFPSQREGVDWLKENNWRGIIADSQGTGKTAQVLTAIGENAMKLCPVLVVAPSSVVWNWEREAYKFVQSDIKCHVVEGIEDELPQKNVHLTIISWDLLAIRISELQERHFKLIIADECHYAKNPESQRGNALCEMARQCEHVVLMSGTPLINNKEEYEVLKAIVGGENPPILRRLLKDVAPNIPKKRRVLIPCEMPMKMQDEYKMVVEEFEEFITDYLEHLIGDKDKIILKVDKIMKAEHLAKISYLRRIIGRAKVPSVAIWTKQLVKKGESVVIFGEHQEILDLLCIALSKLKIECVRLDGSSSRSDRQMSIDNFQTGQVKVFVSSKAGCEGITLTKSCNLAFLERYFTPASEEQAEDRIRRISQTRTTTIWYFLVRDTIDERINDIIRRKRAIISEEMETEDIETNMFGEIIDVWKNVPILKNLAKPLLIEPNIKPKLPKLPDRRIVRAIVFDNASWGLTFVSRALKRRGFKIQRIKKRQNFIFIETQKPQRFKKGSKRRVTVGKDFDVIVAKPVSEKQRVKNYRLKK